MRISLWFLTLAMLLSSSQQASLAGQLDDDKKPVVTRRNTAEVQAFKLVKDAVVNLRGQKTVRENSGQVSYNNQKVRRINGMGTGVVIDARGYILTNFHVVEGIQNLVVTINGKSSVGSLVGYDKANDLAIIKVDTFTAYPTVPLGTSTDLVPAETVLAVGNAYGYSDTASKGIISALKRTVPVSDTQVYENLIQTDASINPGNSGGPLINLDGQMIGIVVAVRVGAQGIGFAIPVNKAISIASELLEIENNKRIYHGCKVKTSYVNHKPLTTVESVVSGSPAYKAGLRSGDRIVQLNGVKVVRQLDFQRALLDTQPTNTVRMVAKRSGKALNLDLQLRRGRFTFQEFVWNRLGIRVKQEDPSVVTQLSNIFTGGLRVKDVRPGSPASKSGIRSGDVLVGLHLWQTTSLADLQYAVWQPVVQQKNVEFKVLRQRHPVSGSIRMTASTVTALTRR